MNNQHKIRNVISEIPMDAIEVYQMLPEGTRCEVIFNELIMSPSPSSSHQILLGDLFAILYSLMKDRQTGKAFVAPFDVYFEPEQSVVHPDIFILLNEKLDIIRENGVHGVPDIIVEIISSNKAYDTKRKRALYETAGVKEYFMIDPENKKVTLLTLNHLGVYEQTYELVGQFTSTILDCNISF